jgi:cobalt/nickel transport protein
MEDFQKYALGALAVTLIFVIPFIINSSAEFAGADDAGSIAIAMQDPNYKPWAQPLWEPPAETESMLFALQAAIGGIIIGYFIGHEKAYLDIRKNSQKS